MLTIKEQVSYDKWQKMKQTGIKMYVFKTGFLLYGMITFFFYMGFSVFLLELNNPENDFFKYIFTEEFIIRFISTFILFSLLGLFTGRTLWKSYKNRWDNIRNF